MIAAHRTARVLRSASRVAILAIGGWTLSASLSAQLEPAWIGTWALNPARSTYSPGPAPHRRGTRAIELRQDGIRIVDDLVRVRGGITHLEWTGRIDGREYRVHGVDAFVTYAYARVDDRTLDVVTRAGGVITSTARETVSDDGRTLTITTIGRNAQQNLKTVVVFER